MPLRNYDHPFARELEHLNDRIQTLEKALIGTSDDDPLAIGDALELYRERQHQALVQALSEHAHSLEEALTLCHQHLILLERRHSALTLRGGAHDLRHADAWWETEELLAYDAELIRRLEEDLARQSNGA